MKKITILALMLFAFTGCMGVLTPVPFTQQSITQGEEKSAGIGDTFFEHTDGQNITDPFLGTYMNGGNKYDLTILELNQERLGLQYNEFYYAPARTVGYTTIPGGWLVRDGYNKRFDYSLSDKIVRFKGTEFEILSVENGQIKYKRVK